MISRLAAVIAAAALTLPAAAHAAEGWVQVESPNFILYTDTDPQAARSDSALLEVFDAHLRARHGLDLGKPARRKLPIYLLRHGRDMRRVAPGMDRDIAGFYTSTPEDTYAVATADRSDNTTLLHEYVHHFMLQHFPHGYPAWLVEGYAEYFMTATMKADYLEVGNYNKNRGSWLSYADWLPFKRMLGATPGTLKLDTQQAMFYAQSWALTHYMLSDPARARQLEAYLLAVGRGADPIKAMNDATGQTSVGLQKSVERYLTTGFPYRRFTLTSLPTPPIVVTPLTPAAAAVVLAAQRVKGDNGVDAPEDSTDGPVLLADVRRLARPHEGDRLADLALARVEVKLGDLAVAERLLTRLRAAHPGDAEVLEVSAAARLKAAETAPADRANGLRAEARAFAGQAHKADPHRYQTLIAYLQGRETVAGYPSKGDLDVFRDALSLAPHVQALRMEAAEALVAREHYAEAARVLRPLAFNPHESETVQAARGMLTALEAKAAAVSSEPVATPAG